MTTSLAGGLHRPYKGLLPTRVSKRTEKILSLALLAPPPVNGQTSLYFHFTDFEECFVSSSLRSMLKAKAYGVPPPAEPVVSVSKK